jgi:hypothetical protein
LDGQYDIVIGSRPIDNIDHFSKKKKMLQHFGSMVVRIASDTDCPDAPSGFRAYSREAAMRMNVLNKYTYTLETIIQAGSGNMAICSVPIRTNPELRKSRLFKSLSGYIKRSSGTIIRAFIMYQPLRFFSILGSVISGIGILVAIRYIVYFVTGFGSGHIQSLILATILILLGAQTFVAGLQADLIAANRKLLEDVQYHVRKLDYDKNRPKEEKKQ